METYQPCKLDVDVEIDKFMIAVRGADIVGAASFNSRAGIPSRPVALLVFNSLSCWQTKFFEVGFI